VPLSRVSRKKSPASDVVASDASCATSEKSLFFERKSILNRSGFDCVFLSASASWTKTRSGPTNRTASMLLDPNLSTRSKGNLNSSSPEAESNTPLSVAKKRKSSDSARTLAPLETATCLVGLPDSRLKTSILKSPDLHHVFFYPR
jgi:hypothetical protein